jgi:acetylornithine deacetylase/succinyl-diaminopimelate desuccinylase-like protein
MHVAPYRWIAPLLLVAGANACAGWGQDILQHASQVHPAPFQVQPLEAADQMLARTLLQELIETNTTHSAGSTTKAAQLMRTRFLEAGFPESDLAIVGEATERKNLVVRYRSAAGAASTTSEKPVLFIGHLDVVEAPRDEWTVEPFKLTETDGYFYGRGTQDMKNSDAAMVTSFLLLKRAGFVPKRDLILALTADEEGGGDNGVEWLMKNRRDLVDAGFAINPDAGGLVLVDGKPVELDLGATEKMYADFVLTATTAGGHSSRPVPENALYLVSDALGRIERSPFPIELNATTRAYLEAEARRESNEKRQLISRVLKPKMDMDDANQLTLDSGYNAVMRTTCVATMMQAGEAENALPGRATANVNCRILPGHSAEETRKKLLAIVQDIRVKVQYRSEGGELMDTAPQKPSMNPTTLSPEVMKPLRAVTQAMWPGVRVVPEMESGSSDSVYASSAGIPTYGFSGMGIDTSDARAHGRDERLRVSAFYTGVEFMREMIKQLGDQ